jgi:hypothetical protein
MQIRTRFAAGLLAAACAAGTVTVAGAAGADQVLAFSAAWTTKVKVTRANVFTFAPGHGSSNVMGNITTHGKAVATGVSTECVGGLVNTDTQTLVASDGSITLTSNDVGCFTGPGKLHGTGTWTVTAATGRYAGAVGSGSIDGRVDLATKSGVITAEGYLVLP